MNYCAQQDPQASRLVFILTSFRDVVSRQNATVSHGRYYSARGPQRSSQSVGMEKVDPSMSRPLYFLGNTNEYAVGDLFTDKSSAALPPSIPAIAGTSDPVGRCGTNPSISPPHPLDTLNLPVSSSNAMNTGIEQDASMDGSPTTMRQRQNSMDTFFDLARVPSNSIESSDSLGENEIDFETLWQWPNSNSAGLTPVGGPGSEYWPM